LISEQIERKAGYDQEEFGLGRPDLAGGFCTVRLRVVRGNSDILALTAGEPLWERPGFRKYEGESLFTNPQKGEIIIKGSQARFDHVERVRKTVSMKEER
jgi:hypothetical protein